MAKPGVMFYFNTRPCLKRLSTEEKGLLFESILNYAEYGIEPELEGAVGVAWDFIKPGIDRDSVRYDDHVLKKQYAAYVREAKKANLTPLDREEWESIPDNERHHLLSTDTKRYPTTTSTTTSASTTSSVINIENKADKPPARTRFIPPSVDEVRAYCQEGGYCVDPETFVDYYTANGWMAGQKKMKDWKATVRNWNRRENEKQALSTPKERPKIPGIPTL